MSEKKGKALQQLGLDDGASSSEITKAYQSKRTELKDKQQSAPTPALAEKFGDLLERLEAAYQTLTSETATTGTGHQSTSPLSQTKLDDLPGVAPEDLSRLDFEPGHVLAGRYTIHELIGQGGMGAVYRAHDKNRDEDIAIKVLLPSLTKNERALARFLDEARISSKLSHPNIVNVYDVQNEGELYFLTMELLEGQGLNQLMETREALQQPFSEKELLELSGQLLPALAYAHQHTVHRDIKPENIWLTEDGHYKLMDFGIAQLQSTSRRTQTGAAMGTAYYMAPEQIKGSKNLDARADLYAVGILLYTLATGDVPAGLIKPLQDKRRDLNPGFCQAVMQCLEADADDRPAEASVLLAALQASGSRKGRASVKRTGSSSSPLATDGPNKWVVATVALIALISVGTIAGTGVWEDWLPASKEEVAREKASVAQLQGEIRVIKQRLESARRSLDSDVRDAERNDSEDLEALEYWQRVTEDVLFNGSQISMLEGKLSVGETLMREDSFVEARAALSEVKDGYQTLYEHFRAAEKLHGAEQASEAAKQRWLKRKQDYDLSDPEEVDAAKAAEQQARETQYAGDLIKAVKGWREGESLWQSAYLAMDGEVARIDQQREADKQARLAAAEEKRRAEAEAQRRAKAKAKRKAAEAERQRIARVVQSLDNNLVDIPAGEYRMGPSAIDVFASVEPFSNRITVKTFKMMANEVTFAQWDACVSDGGCSHKPMDSGWGRGNRPVVNVSWEDITQQFIPWLNKVSEKRFRLPSEAEWEYAARAGSTTRYSWGNEITCSQARYGRQKGGDCSNSEDGTVPVGSFSANQWGLFDMTGNVTELVEDCYNPLIEDGPSDGSAWTRGDCSRRVSRGGYWYVSGGDVALSVRMARPVSERYNYVGFRLVQD